MSEYTHEHVTEEVVLIELSKDEALVLYDLFARVTGDEPEFTLEDPAEAILVSELGQLLKAELTDTRKPDYGNLLLQARARLRQQVE